MNEHELVKFMVLLCSLQSFQNQLMAPAGICNRQCMRKTKAPFDAVQQHGKVSCARRPRKVACRNADSNPTGRMPQLTQLVSCS